MKPIYDRDPGDETTYAARSYKATYRCASGYMTRTILGPEDFHQAVRRAEDFAPDGWTLIGLAEII